MAASGGARPGPAPRCCFWPGRPCGPGRPAVPPHPRRAAASSAASSAASCGLPTRQLHPPQICVGFFSFSELVALRPGAGCPPPKAAWRQGWLVASCNAVAGERPKVSSRCLCRLRAGNAKESKEAREPPSPPQVLRFPSYYLS